MWNIDFMFKGFFFWRSDYITRHYKAVVEKLYLNSICSSTLFEKKGSEMSSLYVYIWTVQSWYEWYCWKSGLQNTTLSRSMPELTYFYQKDDTIQVYIKM